jgi:hypothetical protein
LNNVSSIATLARVIGTHMKTGQSEWA